MPYDTGQLSEAAVGGWVQEDGRGESEVQTALELCAVGPSFAVVNQPQLLLV
jgi:hypothetical protein